MTCGEHSGAETVFSKHFDVSILVSLHQCYTLFFILILLLTTTEEDETWEPSKQFSF
jgi:hypothetical protein